MLELIIKIPEEYYKAITEIPNHQCTADMFIIKNGISLPKDHGRLIDGDKVLDDIEKKYPVSVSETDKCKKYARLVYYWAVKNAPTIIEADKECK
jgi:hypothetical protein